MSETSKLPPTVNQLERIQELISDPKVNGEYLESISQRMDKLIQTRGGAGVLISMLKKRVGE